MHQRIKVALADKCKASVWKPWICAKCAERGLATTQTDVVIVAILAEKMLRNIAGTIP